MNFISFHPYQLRANAHSVVASAAIALFGFASAAQAQSFAPPTVSESNKTFKDPFTLTVSQDEMGSNLKDFRYTKGGSASVVMEPADCAKGTALLATGSPAVYQLPITATTSLAIMACSKSGVKSAVTYRVFTLDKTAPTLVVTGPFASDGTTALLSANNSSTIKYKLTFAGADNIPNNSDLASKITLSPLGASGTIYVSGSGNTARVVTLINVIGNGTAVKIAVAGGTASDSAGNQAIANSTAKTFVLDNTAPTISVKGPSVIHAKASSSVTYTVTYVGATSVTLAAGDISLSKPDGGGDALSATVAVTGSGTATRTVTLSNFTGNGRLGITIAAGTAADAVGNLAPAPSAAIATINVDTTPPTFTVSGPSQENAKATSSVTYTVIYSGATKAITLSPKDIQVNQTAMAGSLLLPTGTIKVIPDPGVGCSKLVPCSVAPDPMKRFVTLSGFKNNGTLGIAIKANSASDLAGNFAAAGTTDSATFNVDTGIPTITVSDPSRANAKADSSVTYTVAYNGVTDVTLSNASISLIKTGTANASFDVSGTGTSGTVTRTVTLNNFTGNGTIKIAILRDTAADTAGNLTPAPAATKTFMVDTTAPGAPVLPASKTFNTAFTAKATKATAADTSFKELRYATASGTSVTAPNDCASGTMLSSGGTIAIPAATTSVAVIACDQAGNKSAPVTATYTFDDGPPTFTVSAPSMTNVTSATPEVRYTVTYSGADKITLSSAQITRIYTGTAWASLAPVVLMDTAIPPDPMKRIVALKQFKGIGTLGISIAARTASDSAGNLAAASSPAVSSTFNVASQIVGTSTPTPTPTPTTDTTPPTVTGVTSSTANASYMSGGVIAIQVNFNEIVTVIGTPTIALNSGAVVNYASGTGTSALTFTYTVGSTQNSADLDYSSTSALAVTTGTSIKDAAGNNATRTLPSPGTSGSLGANKAIVIDTAAPTVTGVTSSTANASYMSGGVIAIQVNFNEIVTVIGTPTLALNSGTTVNYASGTGTSALTFTYTVGGSQNSADLDYLSTSALAVTTGTSIKDAAGNNATRTLPSPAASGSLGANKAIVIDTTAPAAPSVTANQSFTTTFNASISAASDFAKFRYALDSISVLTCATTALAVETSTSNPVTASITSGANWVLQAIACDTAGNASSATTRSYTYVAPTPTPTPTPTVDTTPPAAPIIFSIASLTVSPATTNNLKPPVVGTAEANATLTLYRTVSGVSSTLATVNVNSIGNWSWTSGTNLSVGTYYITAKATDAAANLSPASSTFTLIIQANSCADDAIPAAPVITSIAGDMTSPAYTNNQKPPIVGTSEAGALVTVYKTVKIEGVSVTSTLGTTTASNSGAWTYTPASNLAEGTYDITARITNTIGVNGFEGTLFKLIIDTTAPEIEAQLSPATHEFSDNFDANVYVSYVDIWWSEFLQIRYALDNVSTLNCSTTSSAVIVSFSKSTTIRVTKAAATTTLRAIICDKAGNASTVSSAVYTRSADSAAETDTTPPPAPTISSISVASDTSNTNVSTVYNDALGTDYSYPNGFNIVGSKEIGSVVTVYANAKAKVIMGGDPWGDTWNFSSQDLPPGNYSITATATDSAGNESAHSTPKTLKVVGLAAPCGGRHMTAYYYMPGLEDGDPVMGYGWLLNGSGTVTLYPSVSGASGGHSFSDIGVYLKITNEDGVDKVYGRIDDWQDVASAISSYTPIGWTKVTPSYSTSVLKRFEIPYSNLTNTATTPLNGPALVHVFCPKESEDLPHNITSLEGRFLPQNCTQPRFTGDATCGLSNVPTSFSLKQTYPVTSDGYNVSFSSTDLPAYPSAGRFTSAEVSGVCSVRTSYDRDDPTAENFSFARDVWSFGYSSVPTFWLSWSPAVWDCYSGLWNKMLGPSLHYYSNPRIGTNEVDWRKPVSFWVDSGVDPGFYWRASYVMVGNKQQPDVTPWWWFGGGARVHASKLTTFEVDFKPGFDATPDCSCGLSESTAPTCRDENGIRPTLAFKRSTYYGSRQDSACPGYEENYSGNGMCGGSSSSTTGGTTTTGGMDMSSSSSSSSSSGGMDTGGSSSSSSSTTGGMDTGGSSSSTSTGDSSSSSSTGGTSSTAAPSNFVVTTTSTDVCQDDCWIRNHTFSWTAPSGNNSTLLHYEVSTPVAPGNWFIRHNYQTYTYEYNLSPTDHLMLRISPPALTTYFNSSMTSTSDFRLRAVYGYRTTDPDCDGLCREVPTSYSDYVYPQ